MRSFLRIELIIFACISLLNILYPPWEDRASGHVYGGWLWSPPEGSTHTLDIWYLIETVIIQISVLSFLAGVVFLVLTIRRMRQRSPLESQRANRDS